MGRATATNVLLFLFGLCCGSLVCGVVAIITTCDSIVHVLNDSSWIGTSTGCVGAAEEAVVAEIVIGLLGCTVAGATGAACVVGAFVNRRLERARRLVVRQPYHEFV
jgi:hypothetical protein